MPIRFFALQQQCLTTISAAFLAGGTVSHAHASAIVSPSSAEVEQVLAAANVVTAGVMETQAAVERTLEQLFEDLEAAIAAIGNDHLLGEQLALATLDKITPRLLELADRVIADHETLTVQAHLWEEQLGAARPVLREVSEQFTKFAAAEPYQDLARQYRGVAESLAAIALKYEVLQAQIDPSLAQVSGNLRYVRHTRLFLERLDQILPALTSDDPQLEQLLASLTEYVRAFERLRSQLEALHGATAGALEPAAAAEPADPAEPPIPMITTLLEERQTRPRVPAQTPTSHLQELAVDSLASKSGRGAKLVRRDSSVPKDAAPAARSGTWLVEGSGTRMQITQQGGELSLQLLDSTTLAFGEGRLHLLGNALRVERLVYHTHSGQVIDLSDATATLESAERIRLTLPAFVKTEQGQLQRGDGLQHRVLICEAGQPLVTPAPAQQASPAAQATASAFDQVYTDSHCVNSSAVSFSNQFLTAGYFWFVGGLLLGATLLPLLRQWRQGSEPNPMSHFSLPSNKKWGI